MATWTEVQEHGVFKPFELLEQLIRNSGVLHALFSFTDFMQTYLLADDLILTWIVFFFVFLGGEVL